MPIDYEDLKSVDTEGQDVELEEREEVGGGGDDERDVLADEGLVKFEGDKVILDKSTWEEIRKQRLAYDDYARTKGELNSLIERMKKLAPEEEAKPKRTRRQERDVDIESVVEKKVRETIEPVLLEKAKQEVERETEEFKSEYAFAFTGEAERDNALLAQLYQTAATYQNADGSPLSLEQAFYLLYGNQLMEYLKQYAEVEQKRRELWGSDEGGASGQSKRSISSLEEAEQAFDEVVSKIRF